VIGLGISGGYQATGSPLISAPTSFWALGPLSSVLSLFDGGRRKAEIAVTRAEYDELAARYRETVLTAFQEVEDALSLTSTLAEQEREQRDAARAAVNTERLALDLYRDGASDYLDVVTAQTAALSAEQAAISVGVNRRRAAVALIRAIGGSAAPVS
jgi:multidrug efflux system outer membrane protein